MAFQDPFADIPMAGAQPAQRPIPRVIQGPPREPPPQTPANAARDQLGVARDSVDLERDRLTLQRERAEFERGPAAQAIEGERKAASFFIRALGANRSYEGTGVGPRSWAGEQLQRIAPSILNQLPGDVGNSGQRQVSDTNQDEFIAASLRQDSGAAIPEEELARQRQIYFPVAGDGPEVIAAKAAARRRALEGLMNSAGRSLRPEDRQAFEQWANQGASGADPVGGGVIQEAARELPGAQGPGLATQGLQSISLTARPGERMDMTGNVPSIDGAPGRMEVSTDQEFTETPGLRAIGDQFRSAVLGNADRGELRRIMEQAGPLTTDQMQWIDRVTRSRGMRNYYRQNPDRIVSPDFYGSNEEMNPAQASSAETSAGPAGAAVANFADTASLGMPGLFSEDYRRNLSEMRSRNPGASIAGSLAGGLVLPGRNIASLPGRMGANALMGGAYGFNSSGGDPEAALAGATIGAAVPAAITGVARTARPATNALAARSAERAELRAAAERQKVPLLRADSGGTATRMATGVIGRTPGEIPLVAGARRSIDATARARDRFAESIGRTADETGAGQAAQRGARQWLGESEVRGRQLFERVPIGRDHPAQLGGSKAALQERTAGLESNAMLSEMVEDPRLSGYLAALEGRATQVPTGVLDAQGREITRTVTQGGGLSWGDMRRFRSLIGEKIGQAAVASEGTTVAAYRRLYAGISQDLEATAAQISPRALALARRANQYWRGREARREGVLTSILGRNFDENPQDAFAQINRWAQRQGGDVASVARTLRSMPADEANIVRASIFARMGRATAGRQDEGGNVFSPAEFATQFNKLEPRALAYLVPERAHRQALTDLVRITTAQKGAGRYQQHSNAGLATNFVAAAYGFVSNPVATVVAVVGTYGAGKFLASPAGAGWLSRTARRAGVPNVTTMTRTLARAARQDPHIAQEALGLRNFLLRAANDNTAARAVASPDEGQGEQ